MPTGGPLASVRSHTEDRSCFYRGSGTPSSQRVVRKATDTAPTGSSSSQNVPPADGRRWNLSTRDLSTPGPPVTMNPVAETHGLDPGSDLCTEDVGRKFDLRRDLSQDSWRDGSGPVAPSFFPLRLLPFREDRSDTARLTEGLDDSWTRTRTPASGTSLRFDTCLLDTWRPCKRCTSAIECTLHPLTQDTRKPRIFYTRD